MVKIKSLKKEPLYVISCYILWGLLPVFWKLLHTVSSFYVLASRVIWSLLFCSIIILIKGELNNVKKVFHSRKETLFLVACGIMVTINWGSYILAVNSGNIIECSLAYYMNPIISILLGVLIFHEKLDKIQWLAVLMAALGVLIPLVYYGKFPYFTLIIGGSFAIYGAMKKKVTASSELSIFMETLFIAPIAVIFIIYSESKGIGAVGHIAASKYFLFPLCGAITSIPLLLFATGIKKTPLSLSGIFMYINPTLQLLVGVILYKEKFTNTNLLTFSFILFALLLFSANKFIAKRHI